MGDNPPPGFINDRSFYHADNCIYCLKKFNNIDEMDITQSYWITSVGVIFYPCHKDCKHSGYLNTTYECQCIDAGCNDCKYFNATKTTKEFRIGNCSLKNIEVKTHVQFCEGNECFVHRND